MNKVITASIAALALTFSTAAFAQDTTQITVTAKRYEPGVQVRTEVVKYGDLNIKKLSGAHTLLVRLKTAANEVCSPAPSNLLNISTVTDYNRCWTHALGNAVAKVGNPLLTDWYDVSEGTPA